MMNYFVIINPNAGDQRKQAILPGIIKKKFSQYAINTDIVYTTGPGNAAEMARKAVSEKHDVVIAAGGDGTINEVAGALVKTKTPLGILPLGSGNGLARSLKIPVKIEQALDILCHPHILMMDVGQVNDRFFFGVCGVGFDAVIGYKFQQFGTRGPIPYFIIGFREYVKFRDKEYILNSDTKQTTVSPLFITVANTSQYGAGAVIAPSADFKDGLLNICIMERVSFLKALLILPLLFNGKIEKSKYYSQFLCRSLEITSAADQDYVHTDGEPWTFSKKLTIEIKPAALHVCAPHQTS